MNELLLVVTVVYGILYGLRNLVVRIVAFLQGDDFVQNGLGTTLDILFLSFVVYFATFGFKFITNLNSLYS